MEVQPIEEGCFYHIFNRGNNSEKIFFEEENYKYFLKLLKKYIVPVADIYAYCLLQNHFHFLVRIKEESEIDFQKLKYSTVDKAIEVSASRQFSHFLNAYSQAINKKYARTGSLFEKRFERKEITDENYLRQVILYINTNPLKHNLVEKIEDYKWSSYKSIISSAKTNLKRKEVVEIFDDVDNFVWCHRNYDFLNSFFD